MQTIIDIERLKELKKMAIDRNTTLRKLVNEIINDYLEREQHGA